MAFALLPFEALHSRRHRFGKILIGPRIGPLDRARARKIGKLTSPIQDPPASSGGSARTTLMSDSSCELSTIFSFYPH